MNLNLINLLPSEWNRQDWQDAYAQYCQSNMFGPKTKKEYYDMVLSRHANIVQSKDAPMPDDLKAKWHAGKISARAWAKAHKCDMNGRLLSDIDKPQENINDLADRLDIVEKNHDNLRNAYSMHVMKIKRNMPNIK